MPKNKVQFHQGLSLAQFLQLYGSEAHCEQALFDARWPPGFGCPRCGSNKFWRLSTRRATFQCNRCKCQLSLLAGTLFRSTKLPLTTWFLATCLLSQTKNGISALELGHKLEVNDNTAWLLKHKLMQAMRKRDQGHWLAGTVQVDDAYPGGEHPGGKRGRQARAGGGEQDARAGDRRGPASAAETERAGALPQGRGRAVGQAEFPARDHDERGRAGLFPGVEAAGCGHKPRVPGGGDGTAPSDPHVRRLAGAATASPTTGAFDPGEGMAQPTGDAP